MSNDIKLDILNDIESDIKKFSHIVSKNLANSFSKELINEYEYVIGQFYSEYTPKWYVRHINRGYPIGGLYKTYKRYYKNPHNKVYYGGIEITTDKMYTDYSDDNIDVLNSFLNGFHGRPYIGINSKIDVYNHMIQYRDLLIGFASTYIDSAVEIAKRETYNALTFV